jgi:ABC-2 type transport system ATP-binding protein
VRRNIGVVFQDTTLDLDLTAQENLRYCTRLYGLSRKESALRIDEALELFSLTDRRDQRVRGFSGGMRRALDLARGVLHRPSILFLDEPTLGLDVQTRAAVWKYIRQLKKDYNMTLFLTTHYLEEADSLCDRIAIIDHGHIVKIGTPEELKAAVGGDVIVVGVKEPQPDLTDEIAKIPLVTAVTKTGSEYRIKADAGEEASPAIIDLIRSKGMQVSKISLTRPTLDEAYLELTGRTLREEETNRWAAMSARRTMRTARS